MSKKELPKKPGLYFAKGGDHTWYNIIVNVYNEAPFFKLNGWDRSVSDSCGKMDIDEIAEFGPKIETLEMPNIAVELLEKLNTYHKNHTKHEWLFVEEILALWFRGKNNA